MSIMDGGTEESDEHIAARVQAGDIDAYGTLIDRYDKKLNRYGQKFLARAEDIQDIVQDAFISAYKNIQSFDPNMRFSPWIYRIAHNAFVNALRRQDRVAFMLDFDTFISHHVYEDPAENEREQRDTRAMLEKTLSSLSPKYREILTLHYYENLPYKDIAEVLQIPMGTVAIRMKRAKDALRKTLESHV